MSLKMLLSRPTTPYAYRMYKSTFIFLQIYLKLATLLCVDVSHALSTLIAFFGSWRDGRAVECGGLEIRYSERSESGVRIPLSPP
jgi:hypothetical protein